MNQADTNNESITIEDLAAQNTGEIKGGPNPKNKRFVVLQAPVAGGTDDDDTLAGLASNHNETVAADEAAGHDAKSAQLADLTVSDETQAEVKGGPNQKGTIEIHSIGWGTVNAPSR